MRKTLAILGLGFALAVPVGLLVSGASWSPALAADDNDSNNEDGENAEDEVNYVDLAARLIHDGHYDRALDTLAETEPKATGVDTKRYYTLRGLAYLNGQNYKAARDDFKAAIASGQTEPLLKLYLAQAYFGLKDYKNTVEALSGAGAAGESEPALFLMKSESYWKLGQHGASIATLRKGGKKFPEKAEFERLQIFYLIELGLYLEATDVSERYLAREGITEDDYVAVGEALRSANEFKKAQLILEGAHLRFPESEKVMLQLAHSYLDDERTLSGAMLFEDAARLSPKYTLEAAELYKQSNLVFRAMFLNARVADQAKKTKQRLSLLVDAGNYESVTAMLPKLSRLGLLKDDNIRYALAYAFFKTERFVQAEQQLKFIKQPELFEASLQLRKAMENCRAAGWECTL